MPPRKTPPTDKAPAPRKPAAPRKTSAQRRDAAEQDTANRLAASILETVSERLRPQAGRKHAPYIGGSRPVEDQEGREVRSILPRKNVTVGRASRVASSSMRLGYGGVSNTSTSYSGNFYSLSLPTDFLEQPQGQAERWATYRHFYENHPYIGQAVDLHTELPLSKIKLNRPKATSRELADASIRFCESWCARINLLQRLHAIVHERTLLGVVNIMVEDDNPDVPEHLLYEDVATVEAEDENPEYDDDEVYVPKVKRVARESSEQLVQWMKRNYKGWTSVRCLPPEQVRVQSFNFTDEKIVEYFIDAGTKRVVDLADAGDKDAMRIVKSMPSAVVEAVRTGTNLRLNTDPDAGGFCYVMRNNRSDYSPTDISILQRCMNALTHEDKLRQANASIASRHMTPHRLVWVEDGAAVDVDELREQVDLSIQDPDYSLITNFEVHWEELGSDQRLLDLSSEMDFLYRQYYAGLGVTESLLTGEGSYSGDRFNLELISVRYMLLREQLQDFVDEYLFKPMCKRMGFIELDEDGLERVIYPRLSFTRLPTKDNQDTFNAMFNMYTKGSLDVDTILELLNIDPVTTLEKIKRDQLTPNDPTWNEVSRGIYNTIGNELGNPENTDAMQKVAKELGLKLSEKHAKTRFQ